MMRQAGRTGAWHPGRATNLVLLGLLVTLASACDSDKIKLCHAEMQRAQTVLLEMDKSEVESVSAALEPVATSVAACRAAGRSEEVGKLLDAQRQVKAHLKALEERAGRPERKKLSPGELAELEKKGDPDCPKGQGYEHPQSEKMIKCTGEQLAEMPEEKARSHFQKRGYKISDLGESAFKAEFGAHALEFHYKGRGGPSCLRITGRPGVPWQEIVARATGVHPDRIKKDETVPMRGHPLALTVQGDPAQWTVLLGECAL